MTILNRHLPLHHPTTPNTHILIEELPRRRLRNGDENIFETSVKFGCFYLAGIKLSGKNLSTLIVKKVISVLWAVTRSVIAPQQHIFACFTWEGKHRMTAQNMINIILATAGFLAVAFWLLAWWARLMPHTLIEMGRFKLTMEHPGYALYWAPKSRIQLNINPAHWVIVFWKRSEAGSFRAGFLVFELHLDPHD
jgi:hypothetical protein